MLEATRHVRKVGQSTVELFNGALNIYKGGTNVVRIWYSINALFHITGFHPVQRCRLRSSREMQPRSGIQKYKGAGRTTSVKNISKYSALLPSHLQ